MKMYKTMTSLLKNDFDLIQKREHPTLWAKSRWTHYRNTTCWLCIYATISSVWFPTLKWFNDMNYGGEKLYDPGGLFPVIHIRRNWNKSQTSILHNRANTELHLVGCLDMLIYLYVVIYNTIMLEGMRTSPTLLCIIMDTLQKYHLLVVLICFYFFKV
jgi:hypothetical protein